MAAISPVAAVRMAGRLLTDIVRYFLWWGLTVIYDNGGFSANAVKKPCHELECDAFIWSFTDVLVCAILDNYLMHLRSFLRFLDCFYGRETTFSDLSPASLFYGLLCNFLRSFFTIHLTLPPFNIMAGSGAFWRLPKRPG